jgi:hypothetical protein
MNTITPENFKHKIYLEFFPRETLLGVKTINTSILCNDDEFRPIAGLEFGFIFFKICYAHMSTKVDEFI